MIRIVILAGTLLLLAAGPASAQAEQKPATGASAQGTAQGQAGVTATDEGAAATAGTAGSAEAAAGESSASLAEGTEISAALTKPVDASKARPGDEISARATKDIRTDGQVVVPRGSKLVGRVTQARARGDTTSQLGIVFDRAVLKDGRTVALIGAVTALAAARAAGSAGSAGGYGAGNAGGSAAGSAGGIAGNVGGAVGGVAGATGSATTGVGGAIGGAAGAATRSTGSVGGLDVAGDLQSGSRGVFGIRDLEIASAAKGGAQGSVISSAGRNVRLESGTQMLIVAGTRTADSAENPAREEKDDRR
jgi:hypothetical protein